MLLPLYSTVGVIQHHRARVEVDDLLKATIVQSLLQLKFRVYFRLDLVAFNNALFYLDFRILFFGYLWPEGSSLPARRIRTGTYQDEN